MYTLPFFQLCWVTEVPSLAVLGKVSDIVRSKGRMEKARKKPEAEHSSFLCLLLDKWTGILHVVGAGIQRKQRSKWQTWRHIEPGQ